MADKPTYEESEQRVKELEKEAGKLRRAEEALRESEERYRTILENIEDGYFEVDISGNFSFFNDSMCKILGYPREELMGMNNRQYMDKENAKKVYQVYNKLYKTGKPSEVFDYKVIRKDGNKKYAETSASLIRGSKGKGIGFRGILRDITERKQKEIELDDELKRFRVLYDLTLAMTADRSLDENLQLVVEKSRELLGADTSYIALRDDARGDVYMHNLSGIRTEAFKKMRIPFAKGLGGLVAKTRQGYIIEDYFAEKRLNRVVDKIVTDEGVISGMAAPIQMGAKNLGVLYVFNRTKTVFFQSNLDALLLIGNLAALEITRKQAEDMLRRSEEKYRTILESIEEGYYEVDIAGNFTFVNDSMYKIPGYSRDELIGINYRRYMDEKDAKKVYQGFNRVFKTGTPSKVLDWKLIRKDGTKRSVEISASLIKDSEGHPTGFRGILRDVTERKQTEDSLKESEERFRILVEESPLGISLIGKDGYYKYINPKFVKMFGYTLKDIPTGREWFRKAYPDEEYRHQVISTWKTDLENFKHGEARPQIFNVTCKDGSEKIIHFRPVTMETGDQFIIYEDVTERKQAEAELVQTKDFLQNIYDSSIDGINTTDLHGNIIYASPRSKDILGYEQEEIIGKKIYSLYGNGKKDAKKIMKELTEKGELRDHEIKLINKNGELVDINLSASLLRNEKGEVIGTLGIYRDITDKKKLEVQLLQSEKMASVGQLAAGVAHEINNPTGFVSSNLKTLSDYQNDIKGLIEEYRKLITDLKDITTKENLPSSIIKQVEHIVAHETDVDVDFILDDIPDLIKESKEGTEQIKKIVLDLKDFAHPGEDKIQTTDINKGIDSTLNVVWNELKYKATVTKDYGDLPEVQCYPQQLNQVFMNILVNAAQAIEKQGKIRITTRTLDRQVEISISDTGSGIPKKSLSKIFDPFFTTKEVGKGTGLGLNVAYNIIKKHNGNINVESEVGKGTTFRIRIPVG